MKRVYVKATEIVNWGGYILVPDDFDIEKAKEEETDSNYEFISDDDLSQRLLEAQDDTMFVDDCDGMILRHIEFAEDDDED